MKVENSPGEGSLSDSSFYLPETKEMQIVII